MGMRRTSILLLATFVVLTAGCGEEDNTGAPTKADFAAERKALGKGGKALAKKSDEKTGRDQGKGKSGGPVASTGYAQVEQDYFYDARDKRDPFRSFRFVEEDPEEKNFGPLGEFEVGQLELSAVIWDATNPRALILDPGGRSYIIREGSAIGKNNGQVIHIGDNLVLVKETYENFAGERTTKDVELRIRLSQGG